MLEECDLAEQMRACLIKGQTYTRCLPWSLLGSMSLRGNDSERMILALAAADSNPFFGPGKLPTSKARPLLTAVITPSTLEEEGGHRVL